MATNWNAVLANINNASDILAILRKVLGLLDGKVDTTKIDEIINDISDMQVDVDTALTNVTSALSEFNQESQEAIQQVILSGLMEGFTTEAELLATRPTVLKKYAKAEDTKIIWFWNKPEGAPDGNYWTKSGLSELELAKADATTKANAAEQNAIEYADEKTQNIKVIQNENVVFGLADLLNQVFLYVSKNSDFYIPKLDGSIQQNFTKLAELINVVNSKVNIVDSPSAMDFRDSSQNLLAYFRKNSELMLAGLDNSVQE
ncbi:hypothetical protein NQ787_14605, partial [Acinetobacter baumannii]|nr:hypothetical protein [Acinetobacter baumannii]